MAKPRDQLGETLRENLSCPFCSATPSQLGFGMLGAQAKPLRIVAYRKTTARLECRKCGLRFSIDVENFATTMAEQIRLPDQTVEQFARDAVEENPSQYLNALTHYRSEANRYVAEERGKILEPHRAGLAVDKPRRGQIRFPKRSRSTAP
jgi:hypothetical protein